MAEGISQENCRRRSCSDEAELVRENVEEALHFRRPLLQCPTGCTYHENLPFEDEVASVSDVHTADAELMPSCHREFIENFEGYERHKIFITEPDGS